MFHSDLFALNKCIIFRRCGSHFSCSVNITAFQFRTFFCYFLRLTTRQRMKRDRENEYKIQCERNIKGMPYVTAQCEETICCTAHLNRFLYCKNIMHINWEFHQIQYVHTQAVHLHTASKVQKNRREEKKWKQNGEIHIFWNRETIFLGPAERTKQGNFFIIPKKIHIIVCVRCVFFFNSPLIK